MPSFNIPSSQTKIVLRQRPEARVISTLGHNDSTFERVTEELPSAAHIKDAHVLIRVEHVSLDPAMRGWLRDARSYIPPVQIGEVMRAAGVGTVVASKFPGLAPGDKVSGTLGWQEYAHIPGKACEKRRIPQGSTLLDYLGPLGSSGQTAYWGIFDVGAIKPNDVVVVTGAAGSVGSIVVQLAKLKGCKVIAIAGSDDKCQWLKQSLKADEALNYKDKDFKKTYREVAQKKYGYIDVVFENVGGEVLDLTLLCLKPGARIALCGAIAGESAIHFPLLFLSLLPLPIGSTSNPNPSCLSLPVRPDYNNPKPTGLKNYQTLIAMRAKLQGFIVFDYAKRYAEAEAEISRWLAEGKLERKFHIVASDAKNGGEALTHCPQALNDLFDGKNVGKMVVKVAEAL
ncbi:hypothetical protein ACQY0O_008059 [Thecaphora frezii]